MERTYIMLKPDALQRGLIGEILARIERKGYRITAMKTMQLDEPINQVRGCGGGNDSRRFCALDNRKPDSWFGLSGKCRNRNRAFF